MNFFGLEKTPPPPIFWHFFQNLRPKYTVLKPKNLQCNFLDQKWHTQGNSSSREQIECHQVLILCNNNSSKGKYKFNLYCGLFWDIQNIFMFTPNENLTRNLRYPRQCRSKVIWFMMFNLLDEDAISVIFAFLAFSPLKYDQSKGRKI